ncbi:MAG: hypothetical protein ACI9SP_002702 [Arenicella sp.]
MKDAQSIARACIAALVYTLFTNAIHAQTVAILDQGFNTSLSHRGSSKFTLQNCISYPDRFVELPGPPPEGFSVVSSPFTASLCGSGQPFQFLSPFAAAHPRTFFVPPTGETLTTTNTLNHARIISDAIWDFNRDVFHQHFQVYGMAGNHAGDIRTLVDIVADNSRFTSSYKTNSGQNIIDALNYLAITSANTGTSDSVNVGAVSISSVISGPDKSTPPLCDGIAAGQNAVDTLRGNGIAVVAGLRNNNIPANAKSWPNCIRGVINVGRTDGFSPPFTGIGIGDNGIDFYTKSAVQNGTFVTTGNSYAGPKVAAAFALLHEAHPNSTVSQKYRALDQASSSMFSFEGFKRRRIRNSQVDDAIELLEQIIINDGAVTEDPDNIHFDPTFYGLAYGGSSTDSAEVSVIFSSIVSTKLAGVSHKNSVGNSRKDIILEFTGLVIHDFASTRKFKIMVNGQEVLTTESFVNGGEAVKRYVINRKNFSEGENTISIEPLAGIIQWGVKDIKVNLLPTIALQVGSRDNTLYGYSQAPTRFTGARFKFELPSLNEDYDVTLKGWDIDTPDETQIFLNGESIGFVTQGVSNQFSKRDKLILDKALLIVGTNFIELQQREPDNTWRFFEDEKWAVKEIQVNEKGGLIFPPIIMLLLVND